MDSEIVKTLEDKALEMRREIITMIHQAKSGHPGGSLSATDIVCALYFHEMNVDPGNPKWEDRDRFVLSKGHACPVQYVALALKGYFDKEELKKLRVQDSILQGHPDMKRCPGIDISTGSLGQGISVATGFAISAKMKKKDYRTFVLVGDGESQEGQVWEALEAASKYNLDNLVVVFDNNGLQNDGFCDKIMPTRDLAEKAKAFGCETYIIDGHNMAEIVEVLDKVRSSSGNGLPKCIVAKTVKGKGVSFMENVPIWHGQAPNDEEYAIAMKELGGAV